jgi:hypothetical protein
VQLRPKSRHDGRRGTHEESVGIFKLLGFHYATADLEGYRQGSLNSVLSEPKAFTRVCERGTHECVRHNYKSRCSQYRSQGRVRLKGFRTSRYRAFRNKFEIRSEG